MSLTADVIIIGGGVIGSSVNYYLTKRGKRVIQLERSYFNSGASGSCDTMIAPHTKEPNEHLQLALYSVELYKTIAQELGRDIEYEQKGSLLLIENEDELHIMEGIVKKQNALGLNSRIIDVDETMYLQPGLNRDAIVGASYSEVDADVNPFRLNLAFADKAVSLGAKVFTHEAAQEILLRNGAVAGVKTNRDTYYAPIVINAAGSWAPISISRNIWATRPSSSACTAEASTPPSRLQVAAMVISSAWADTTVTSAPMGRTDSIYWDTAVTMAPSTGSFSSLATTTFTVPLPFHRGSTAALPTPDTDRAHCL